MILLGLKTEESWLPLIQALVAKGFKVATLIEAAPGFDPDIPGKDSYRHRKAGAQKVLLLSDLFAAKVGEGEFSFAFLLNELKDADVVLIKGFEAENFPKIWDFPFSSLTEIADFIAQKAKSCG